MNDVELFEAAVLEGIERGMDSAPVVPGLAERARGLPQPRRRLPVLAVAASVVVVVGATGLLGFIFPHTSHEGSVGGPSIPAPTTASEPPPTASPTVSPTTRSLGLPPYPVAGAVDPQTASRALGSWQPVWIFGYDGSWRSSDGQAPQASLAVSLNDGGPARAGGFQLRLSSCTGVGGGPITPAGAYDGGTLGSTLQICRNPNALLISAFQSVAKDLARISVSADGHVLTAYGRSGAIAQFARPGSAEVATHPWSVTGRLYQGLVGTWNYDNRANPIVRGTLTLELEGGGLTLTGTCGTTYDGFYRLEANDQATFTWHNQNTSVECLNPFGSWAPPKNIARVGLYQNQLAFYDSAGKTLAVFRRINVGDPDIVGQWLVLDGSAQLGGLQGVQFLADGTFVGGVACNSLSGHFTVGEDGSSQFTSLITTAVGCVAGAVFDPGTSIADVKRVSLTAGVLTLYAADGKVIGHLGRRSAGP